MLTDTDPKSQAEAVKTKNKSRLKFLGRPGFMTLLPRLYACDFQRLSYVTPSCPSMCIDPLSADDQIFTVENGDKRAAGVTVDLCGPIIMQLSDRWKRASIPAVGGTMSYGNGALADKM